MSSRILPGINTAIANLKFIQGMSVCQIYLLDVAICMWPDCHIAVMPTEDLPAYSDGALCTVTLMMDELQMLDITRLSVCKLLYTQLVKDSGGDDWHPWAEEQQRSNMRKRIVKYIGDEDLLRLKEDES